MANVKISQLPGADAALGTQEFEVNESGTSKKVTGSQISTYVRGQVVLGDLGITATASEINKLDGVTTSTAELNILDGLTATTAELNILDGVTATTAELNILDGVTATTAELNHVDGVTSNIQTQLDGKQASLGFTPVQQGGGAGQLTNKVYIGWTGSQLGLQVDSTNFGANWPINILGVGQTWQQVSRSAGTSYQNTTGRPIMFALYFRPETTYVQVSSNNSSWVTIGNGGGGSGEWGSVSAIVPNGWYYRTTGGTIGAWGELR